GCAPGPGQRGTDHPVRSDAAGRDGDPGGDRRADAGDLVALTRLYRRRAVFLDKDGTLVEDVPYNVDPDRIRLTARAGAGLGMLHRAGFRLVVVTNQSGVARGMFAEEALGHVEHHLRRLL